MRWDETVETSSPRHVNRSERPRSTHGENRGRIPFVSLSLSLPFFLSPSAVWVRLLERQGRWREKGGQQWERALISAAAASHRYFRADRRDKKHFCGTPISFVGWRRLPEHRRISHLPGCIVSVPYISHLGCPPIAHRGRCRDICHAD